MNKAPASQFFWRDWAADLEEHPLRIEGAWIRICSKLAFSEERGKLTKTVEQWARILRTPEPETREILEYIGREQIGDLEWDNDRVTVVCRRMYREYLDKVNHRLRQKRYRERRKRDGRSDGGVTSMSQAQKKEKNLPLNNPPLKEKENQEYVFEEELRNSSSQPFARSRKIGSRPAAGNGASSEPHAEYIARVKTEAQDILRERSDDWSVAYPALDLQQEVSKALAWLDANPKSRKKNIARFLVNWLSKAQDRGPSPRSRSPSSGFLTVEEQNRKAAEEFMRRRHE